MSKRLLIFLVLCLNTYAVFCQNVKVTGRVTSLPENEAIIGGSVIVKGTTTGTVTDINGNFSVNVPSNDAVLVFSYLGYTAIEEKVDGRSVINVSLTADVLDLGEVVVVGYGTQKREDLSSAIAVIKPEQMLKVPGGFGAILQSQVSGVQMTGDKIRIRG